MSTVLDPATGTAPVPPTSSVTAASRLGALLRARETGIAVAFLLFLAVVTIANPKFLFSSDGWRDLTLTPALLVCLAVGQAMVIITRNVDLSVGSILGLTAYLSGRLFIDTGLPVIAVAVLAVLVGMALGLINGMLVAFAKVPALVITLGTLYIYRGVVLEWAGSNRINADDVPSSLSSFGTTSILGIPKLALLSVVVVLVVAYVMRTSRMGRELYAVGSDPDAAVLYGLRVRRRVLTAFAASGALAGLAGVLFVARYGAVSSGAGLNIELQAVGAAVIGGVAIFGGSGTVVGAAFGAYLLTTINRGLPVIGISDFWQGAVVGALILGSITLDRVLAQRQKTKLLAERDR